LNIKRFTEQEIEQARAFLRQRNADYMRKCENMHAQAVDDCRKIIDIMITKYGVQRIYQWGSLLNKHNFRDYSDIDIAVEGLKKAEDYFALLEEAQQCTAFPVDIVEIEKIEPEYADEIKQMGKVVYERGQ
jgi:predicted nucleotidyltransferase